MNRARLEKILRANPKVRALSRNRTRIVLVQPKPTHRGEPDDRQWVVGLYDYDENKHYVSLIDQKSNAVVALESTLAPFQLSEEERREAERLIVRDSRVRSLLSSRAINPLTRLYFPPNVGGTAQPHRYAVVFIRPSSRERFYGVVDLSLGVVTDILTRHEMTGR